jgi:ribosomal-protein-alanine N-acetyltransferase
MELVTKRLILREFIESDWPAVLAYQADPRYLRYYEWTERTPEAVQAFVAMFVAHQHAEPRTKFQLAITSKSDHQLIGNCGVRMASSDAHEGEIGYELAPWHWGQGYATEAARAVVRFGFTGLGLHRIWAQCNAVNTASAHVLEKVGMRLEGRLRDKAYFKGHWWDTLLYAMLDYEWHEGQGA